MGLQRATSDERRNDRFKVKATDSQGRRVELKIDPVTAEVLRSESRHDSRSDDRRGAIGSSSSSGSSSSGSRSDSSSDSGRRQGSSSH